MAADRDNSRTCLHLVCGPDRTALAACTTHCAGRDSILFLDAGVLHALGDELAALSAGGPALYFLAADLRAHGLHQAAADLAFEILDDADFGRLLSEHDHCLSWK